LRDGVVPQKTLLSFTDVPKLQTVTPLKSQKTEVNETLFAASVPMKKEADTRVLQRILRMVVTSRVPGDCRTDTPQGGEVVGTAPKSVRQILSDRRRYGYAEGFATADREPRRSTIAGALRGEVAPRCTSGSVRKVVTQSMRVKRVRCCSPSLYRVHAVDA